MQPPDPAVAPSFLSQVFRRMRSENLMSSQPIGSGPIHDWQPIATAPDGVPVLTKIDDSNGVRNAQPLLKRGRLWWFTDDSMYVYYTPTHWCSLPEGRSR